MGERGRRATQLEEWSVIRAMVSAFLVIRLECRKLTISWEDVMAAWVHRAAVEVVLPVRRPRERLIERIDQVFPF